ncbi:MAG TPA: hypothetical protein VMT27_06590 [Actinomycetes bacterium]|nr:hypothetical protein [Actinomycetes bacterium]
MPALRLLPELEDAIRHIPGVRAASVVTDPQAQPTEVHVLAAPGKPAKQIVRDVQSLAMAQYDLDLDHRIVSVVQIADESGDPTTSNAPDDETPAAAGSSPSIESSEAGSAVLDQVEASARPVIAEITLRRTGTEAEAEVNLTFGRDTFVGIATGAGAASQRPRLVAQATLIAIAELLGLPADVESASVVDTGTNPVALVVLTVNVPRLGAQSVAGSAVVRGDEADAVARAVLAALNRRLVG